MKTAYLVHGWGGDSEGGWFNWLKVELPKKRFNVEAFNMPDSNNPKIETWVKYLEERVPFEKLTKETYLIGHSVGCQTIMRYLEKSPKQKAIGGCVFVAGWFDLINLEPEEIDIAHPWINTKIDFSRITRHTNNILAIFSDNDPYVHLDEVKKFKENLGAKIIIKKKQGHFEEVNEIPEILEFVK